MHAPTHLTNFLSCSYLSVLERAAREKLITKPFFRDPLVELLQRQGDLHEKNYLNTLKQTHKNIVELSRGNFDEQVQQTIAAMKEGEDVIYQGALTDGEWRGYSDFLVKTNSPSKLGNYSYNIVDTKLSAEVKSEAILQLCIYAELVKEIQGQLPDEIAIVGGTNEKHAFNPSDFTAYLRYVKKKYLESLTKDVREVLNDMPEPVEHCHTCDWRSRCEEVWHTADHLKLVAGTSKLQRKELLEQGTNTLAKLAQLPAQPELPHSSPESTARIYKQAKIQLKGRISKKTEYEYILPVIAQQGLAGIPVPNEGDIWFDIEGDTYIGELGLEYLFGWMTLENSTPQYHFEWAKNNTEERHAIENFIRVVMQRRKEFPGMHVYHYGHYEESVVKRLSTRYNLLVDEVDDLLRNEVFINLLRVVKNGLRLSVEGYGLKEIEGHFGLVRNTDLSLAARARKSITLLLDNGSALNDGMMNTVRDYNMEDCLSTYHLHQWLEQRRDELIKTGTDVPRFIATPPESKENIELEELAILSGKLYKLLPEDFQDLTPKQKAIKSLADLMLWYRREDKSHWWEYFRMKELMADELMEERKGLGGPFEYLGVIEELKKSKVHRWKFLPQPFDGADDDLNLCGEEGRFNAHNFDPVNGWLDVKMGAKLEANLLPKINNAHGLFASSHIKADNKIARIKELAEWVLANEIDGEGEFPAARNLLLKKQLLVSSNGSLRHEGEPVLDSAIRLVKELTYGHILPVQGPPGTGKTFTAAHMICELVSSGKKSGITAQSHAVVENLMNEVHKVNEEKYHLKMDMIKQFKSGEDRNDLPPWMRGMASEEIAYEKSFDLIGGTSFMWAREEMRNKVDVLFIDEAGQFALADAVAASHSAASLVLLGDPQQLENVTQGVHPPEIEVSVLGYWLGEHKVIPDDLGLFLENTYRMAEAVNEFISKTFYEGKLHTIPELKHQRIISTTVLNGSGIRFIPCMHIGNQNRSAEEVELIRSLIDALLQDGEWINKKNEKQKLTGGDILLVAPYNAQVNALKAALPGLSIGTVDKFQGRQAPIVIYSMTTSSPEDAPRGMEFLYSLNRLNVAVSRAQCLAVIVASPALFEISCRTPQQMRLANAFCRFLEMAG